ncbi:Polygalacturonase [Arthrobotrys entomopaga]|nr:Polygalacturonase [Arthrobotrys entomopaga]
MFGLLCAASLVMRHWLATAAYNRDITARQPVTHSMNSPVEQPDRLIRLPILQSTSRFTLQSKSQAISQPQRLNNRRDHNSQRATKENSFSLNKVYSLTVQNVLIDNRAGGALGKNTDGFNINNAESVYLTHLTVYNQDDCMNFNTGQNIHMTNSVCTGGHGLSIGSIAGGAVVRDMTYDTINDEQIPTMLTMVSLWIKPMEEQRTSRQTASQSTILAS